MRRQLPHPPRQCPVCGSNDIRLAACKVGENLGLLGKRYQYIYCKRCYIISQYPLTSGSLLGTYYGLIDARQRDWYASVQGQLFLEKAKRRQHCQEPLLKKLIRSLAAAGEQLYPYWHQLKPGPVVDLGAGSGGFCLEASKRGFSVTGIEQSKVSVQLAKQSGIGLIQADLASPEARRLIASASNVVMNHVFEHVLNPITFLSDLKSSMAPDASLILLIPNPNSIWRFAFGRRWYGWDPPVHVHHYSIKALKKTLQRVGFEVLELRSIRRNDSLAAALNQVGINPGRLRLLLRGLMIPIMPILAWAGLGPELLCVAKVGSALPSADGSGVST